MIFETGRNEGQTIVERHLHNYLDVSLLSGLPLFIRNIYGVGCPATNELAKRLQGTQGQSMLLNAVPIVGLGELATHSMILGTPQVGVIRYGNQDHGTLDANQLSFECPLSLKMASLKNICARIYSMF